MVEDYLILASVTSLIHSTCYRGIPEGTVFLFSSLCFGHLLKASLAKANTQEDPCNTGILLGTPWAPA